MKDPVDNHSTSILLSFIFTYSEVPIEFMENRFELMNFEASSPL